LSAGAMFLRYSWLCAHSAFPIQWYGRKEINLTAHV
jgi:hypothetical protein